MNKIVKEIASVIENINEEGDLDLNIAGLDKEQIDMVIRFSKAFNRSGYIPFPLKAK